MIAEGATDEEVSIYRQPDPVDTHLGINETCYRYQPKLSSENTEVVVWLEEVISGKYN